MEVEDSMSPESSRISGSSCFDREVVTESGLVVR